MTQQKILAWYLKIMAQDLKNLLLITLAEMAFWRTSVQSSDNLETEGNCLLTQPFPTRRLSQCVTSHKFHRLFCCRFWLSWWQPSDLWFKKHTAPRFMLSQLHVRSITGFVVVAWNYSCKNKEDEGRLISKRMRQGAVQHRTVQKVNKHMTPLLTLSCTPNQIMTIIIMTRGS